MTPSASTSETRAEASKPGSLFLWIIAWTLLIGFCLLGGSFGYLILTDQEDVLNSIPSPEFQGHVQKLGTFSVIPTPTAPSNTLQDFDGDGVPDRLDLEYFNMEKFRGRRTSGLLVVKSGRTGEVLYSRAVSSPFSSGKIAWFGDKDRNGTMDIMIVDERRHSIVGYVGRP